MNISRISLVVGTSIILSLIIICKPNQEKINRYRNSLNSDRKFDTKIFKEIINKLSLSTENGRYPGTSGYNKSIQVIEEYFEKWNIEKAGDLPSTYKQTFINKAGIENHNIVGKISGQINQYILLGAHIDHLKPHGDSFYHGADDNASGVSLVLKLSKFISTKQKSFRHGFIFVLFSSEETGLEGSKNFAEKINERDEEIIYMMNFDMIGRLRQNKLSAWGFSSSPEVKSIFDKTVQDLSLEMVLLDQISNNSDHWPFYKANIPIGMFHTGLHKDYHKTKDTSDKINYQGIAQIEALTKELLIKIDELDKITFAPLPLGLFLDEDSVGEGCAVDIHSL